MRDSANAIVKLKNQWLRQQVEVEHPTKESLAGCDLYMEQEKHYLCEAWCPLPILPQYLDDIYLVDFHRLTVTFALLQAEKYDSDLDKGHIIEFLTQVIYSEPCELYLGYENGDPVACAIVTLKDNDLLVSDVVVKANSQFGDINNFVAQLHAKLNVSSEQLQCYIQY
ncbi:hypothetical protein ACXJY6_10435 [Vibrio sp. RC27]